MEIFKLSSQELDSLILHTNTSLLTVMKDVRSSYKVLSEQYKQVTNFSHHIQEFSQCTCLIVTQAVCRKKPAMTSMEGLMKKADIKEKELIKYLKECEKKQEELRIKMGLVPQANKENKAPVYMGKLKKLSQKEVLALKESALLDKARVLFKKFEVEKAVVVQRAYRRYLIRKAQAKKQAAIKVQLKL
eukprot:TRINITY_DN72572_c0_g1_i1.p1 TRINITY_DN72572_c0_g1~~TRINITY_DN72572_c0_g1_i1.p1  ORF type:complete len:218 (-),score=31.22 TRINITY_DN72572_c0_g1_i1:536-1099(-)